MATRTRRDPVSRPVTGARPWDKLTNKDPNRHYVLVNPNDEETGLDYYLSNGYDIETKRPGAPRPVVGRTVGEGTEIRTGGQVLVSCPLEEYTKAWEAGQRIPDEFDRRALGDGNIDDPMRGRHGYDYKVTTVDGRARVPLGPEEVGG